MEQKLLNIVAEILDIEVEQLSLESKRNNIEKWDSLGHIQLVAMIEDEFNANILVEEINTINKVSDFIKFIK
jgi:acyl carrier protein